MTQSARDRAIMASIKNKKLIDSGDVHQLTLHGLNDGDYFRGTLQPAIDSIQKKMLKNKFNEFEERKKFALKLGNDAQRIANKDREQEEKIHPSQESKIIAGNDIINRLVEIAGSDIKLQKPKLKFLIARKEGSREEFLKEQENVKQFLSR